MLAEKIEKLRKELERELEYDNLCSDRILEMSRILDALIYEYIAVSTKKTPKAVLK